MACNCKKATKKNERARKQREKHLVFCNNCKKPLKGWNNKVYPIDVSSVEVPLIDIETWKEQGYDIIVE